MAFLVSDLFCFGHVRWPNLVSSKQIVDGLLDKDWTVVMRKQQICNQYDSNWCNRWKESRQIKGSISGDYDWCQHVLQARNPSPSLSHIRFPRLSIMQPYRRYPIRGILWWLSSVSSLETMLTFALPRSYTFNYIDLHYPASSFSPATTGRNEYPTQRLLLDQFSSRQPPLWLSNLWILHPYISSWHHVKIEQRETSFLQGCTLPCAPHVHFSSL